MQVLLRGMINMFFNGKQYTLKIWNGERLNELIALDTETELIKSPSHVPEVILIQAYDGKDTVYLLKASQAPEFFQINKGNKYLLHNAAFDFNVLEPIIGKELVFKIYDKSLVYDTSLLFRLLHLGTVGHLNIKYSLDFVTKKFLNVDLPKEEEIRLTFGQYLNTEINDMPRGHLEYAAKDVIATMSVYLHMLPMIQDIDKYNTLLSHDIQVKGDLALSRITRRGIGFDLARKEEWLKEQDAILRQLQEKLSHWGWVRGQKGINGRFEQILEWLGIKDKLPLTESGAVSSKSLDLEKFRHLEFIDDYLSFNELEKATQFVRDLESNRIHPRYTVLLNTGRTSSSKPNIQQVPKKGNIREMYIPRQNHVLIDIDYSAIELATLSQVTYSLYGESIMRDRINDGEDLHRYYASVMNGCKPDEVTKDQRQEAKAANFGFPGGLGIDTFIEFSTGYGLALTKDKAQQMKDTWFEAFPEMKEYMKNEKGYVYTLTGRRRGHTTYCAEKNTPFQGLAADGLKLALYELDRLGYDTVAEIHDQIVIEYPKDGSEEKAMIDIEQIMIQCMNKVVPDVKVSTEGQILERWCK